MSGFRQGQVMVVGGCLTVAVALLGLGLALLLSTPKEPETAAAQTTRRVTGILLVILALALPVYVFAIM